MAEDFASKTEEPTPKRREQARTDGKVAQSTELTGATVLLAALLAAQHSGAAGVDALRGMMRDQLLTLSARDVTPGALGELWVGALRASATVVAPIVVVAALAALGAKIAQIGFHAYPKRLIPDLERLWSPKTLGRIFSRHGIVELVKALLKIGLVGWITWRLVESSQGTVIALAGNHPAEMLTIAGVELGRVFAWTSGTLAILAFADYGWQRWDHEQSLKMTKEEVKDERRQSDGDPKMKARLRRAYEKIARERSLDDVPTADVVITNPVHLAVALKYRPGAMGAPVVVAKGAERMAERIKEVARRHGVPIVERRALARALFRTVPIGREIPATLFRAVAEILAYIYALRKAG